MPALPDTPPTWREVPSPALPDAPPTAEVRAARLAGELDAAFKARARLYRDLLLTLAGTLGSDEAERLLAAAIRRRGSAAGDALFGGMAERTPAAVASRFLSVGSPDWGRLFPHAVHAAPDGAVRITVHRCPLKDAWTEDGATPGEVAALCRIAGEADHGLFGASGCALDAVTWTPGRDGCCVLTLSSR